MAPIIRDAAEADLPRIVELLDQLSLVGPREEAGPPLADAYREAFSKIEADKNQRLLVLEEDGRVLGSIVLLTVPNLTHLGRPYAIVESVVVDEAARGRRYGEALLRYAIAEARKAGCYKLSLTSHRDRKDAHRFYERLGFRPTHEGFRIEF